MKTKWIYISLADPYLKWPSYSSTTIEAMLSIAKIKEGSNIWLTQLLN